LQSVTDSSALRGSKKFTVRYEDIGKGDAKADEEGK